MKINSMLTELRCPYCGSKAKLVDSKVIYGKSYGKAYICEFYPGCDSYVGCHKGTDKPLGTLANKELRRSRNECHLLFDSIWKSKHITRKQAYLYLSRALSIPLLKCHFAMFDYNMTRIAKKIICSWNIKPYPYCIPLKKL